MMETREDILNDIDNFKDLMKVFALAFIVMAVLFGGLGIKRYYFAKMEWDKLKNNCELSAILNHGYYKYICKIDSNFTTVIYDKLEDYHWGKFKTKNNCQLIKIDFTASENKNQWTCDNNLTVHNDYD